MIENKISEEAFTFQIIKWVEDQITKDKRYVPVGVSNRHIHLNREDMDILFGKDSELTRMKELKQPGQYAAEETVTLSGPKKDINSVRVLGPLRPETQVEISFSDAFVLGIDPMLRDSGSLVGTPGVEIIGPNGSIKKKQGVIVAKRHIHMLPEDAQKYGLHDNQLIDVQVEGPRGGILNNVLVRVTDTSGFEMHIDIEEANGLGLKTGDDAIMVLPESI